MPWVLPADLQLGIQEYNAAGRGDTASCLRAFWGGGIPSGADLVLVTGCICQGDEQWAVPCRGACLGSQAAHPRHPSHSQKDP